MNKIKNLLLALLKNILALVCAITGFYLLVMLFSYLSSDGFDDRTYTQLTFVIPMFLISFILLMFLPRTNKEKYKDSIQENAEKIDLSTSSDLDYEYKEIGDIYIKDDNSFESAKKKLKLKAAEMGASAVINITQNIDNDVKGRTSTLFGRVSGSVNTYKSYLMQGVAVQYTSDFAGSNFSKLIGEFITYDSATGTGTIRLTDNTKLKFKIDMWEDPEFIPEMGMKGLNIYNDNGKIRVMSQNYQLENLEKKIS